jgi:molybdopterin converting factor small subunit
MITLNINLIFFGALKNYFGENKQMKIPKGTRLGIILDILKEKEPGALEILNLCQISVDSELEMKDFIIVKSAEIAILPPFSGG